MIIKNIIVGSLGIYPPMPITDIVDEGPHLDEATNYPGADRGESREFRVDISNVFYQVLIPSIWLRPKQAYACAGGSNAEFMATGTNIPRGVDWLIYPTNFDGHADFYLTTTNLAWVAPGTVATNYKIRATSKDNTNFYDEVDLTVLKVEMTAYRPTTDRTIYGLPFEKHAITNSQEENPGAGIRVNGDDDNFNSTPDRNDTTVIIENDLIEVELKAEPYPARSVTYVLKRSNSNIKVWNSQAKGTAILDSGTEAEINFSAATRTVWVENPNGGSADLEFIARSETTDICSDNVHFYPFTSIVIVLGGEDQIPGDPPDANYGVFQLAIDLYGQGYDVHMYDEDNVNYEGAGATYDEVVNAIQHRNVTSVAIFGYSHGGGSTYDLAERLNNERGTIGTFVIPFTAYIDAIENDSDVDTDQEHRRPHGTSYHVSYYQEGVDNLFVPGYDFGYDGGPITSPGADYEINVDRPMPTETHFTIDDEITILDEINTRLILRVTK